MIITKQEKIISPKLSTFKSLLSVLEKKKATLFVKITTTTSICIAI